MDLAWDYQGVLFNLAQVECHMLLLYHLCQDKHCLYKYHLLRYLRTEPSKKLFSILFVNIGCRIQPSVISQPSQPYRHAHATHQTRCRCMLQPATASYCQRDGWRQSTRRGAEQCMEEEELGCYSMLHPPPQPSALAMKTEPSRQTIRIRRTNGSRPGCPESLHPRAARARAGRGPGSGWSGSGPGSGPGWSGRPGPGCYCMPRASHPTPHICLPACRARVPA